MKKQLPSLLVLAIAAAFALAGETLLANGESFFVPANRGPVDLVYFARVKNARTGRPIEKAPYVTIVDPYSGIIMPFVGDSPGHFRSPDIGKAIKEVTTHAIDTRQLEVVVTAKGYQTVKVANIPRQSKGAVELNVRMEPKGNAAGESASVGAATDSRAASSGTGVPADSFKPTLLLLATCFGFAAIAAVARTVGRPASTRH